MPDLITLFLALGAAARITRLVVADTITAPLRNWALPRIARSRKERDLIARTGEASPPTGVRGALVTLLTCHWCAGMWVSAAIVPAAVVFGDHPAFQIPAAILTVAYLVGFLADQER